MGTLPLSPRLFPRLSSYRSTSSLTKTFVPCLQSAGPSQCPWETVSGRQRARQGLEGAGCWLWSPSPSNRAGRLEAALSPSGERSAERPTDGGIQAPLLCHALRPELLCGYCFRPPAPKPPPKTSLEVPPPSHMESTWKPSVAAQRGERKAPILGLGLTLCTLHGDHL